MPDLIIQQMAVGRFLAIKTACFVCKAFDPNQLNTPPIHREYIALWDTGATGSVITRGVANALGLAPIGIQQVHGAHGTADCNVYKVNITLQHNEVSIGFSMLDVTEGVLVGCDVLIGMDIISQGNFRIDNNNGNNEFTFQMPMPSQFANYKDSPLTRLPGSSRNAPCHCGSGKKYKQCHGS